MKYVLKQIAFTNDEYIEINARIGEGYAKYLKYLDTISGYDDAKQVDAVLKAKADGLYQTVAEIEADSLEKVYEIGNIGPESKITRLDKMHSVSVGDIVEENGVEYVVASFGFVKL